MLGRGAFAAIVVVLLHGAAAHAHTPPAGAIGGTTVQAAASKTETIETRQRYFGAENVDPATGEVRRDKLILSWFGVTNFALAIRGHVLLLDAWVPRGAHSGYVPSSPDQLAALRPEAILIGHGHFDHAADAVPIAMASGATLIGTAEHCADFAERAAGMQPPRCVEATPPGAVPGTRAGLPLQGVTLTAVKHIHSAARAPAEGFHVPVLPLPSTTQLENPATPADLIELVGHLPDAEGGDVLYRFEVGDMKFVWHDTAGPLSQDEPGVIDVLRSLRPVDLHVGAIQGFNQITNAMRDPLTYIEAIGAPLFVPAHHDDWAAGITTKGENYRAPLMSAIATLPEDRRPEVRFIADPTDYVRPEVLTFAVELPRPKLSLRCRGRRVRASLTGDLTDVANVRYVLRGRRSPVRATKPFAHRFARRGRRHRVVATVTRIDGVTLTLRRTARCEGR